MKCPDCNKNISNKLISHHLASIGGKKSKRAITPKERDGKGRLLKMQEGRRKRENS